MSNARDVAVIVGSLRRESLNLKMARALIAMAPPTLAASLVEIGDLPLYNQDLEESPPAAWGEFRTRMKAAEAVLFVTEYNRSIPSPMKNAIDVGSRPYGSSVWTGKPAAVVSVSPGAMGGFGANHHLRQTFGFLDMPAMQQPEAYIANAGKLFDAEGRIAADATRELMAKFLVAFTRWVEQHAAPVPAPS
jgi:chromate reductase